MTHFNIDILPKDEDEVAGEINKCFGIQLDHAKPSAVKIKSPMLIVELVPDARSKK